jgi:hypothetical protein
MFKTRYPERRKQPITQASYRRLPRNQSAGISQLHTDCDLYASAATARAHAVELLRSGSVVVFPEHFNYRGAQNHEFKARGEFAAARRDKMGVARGAGL